MGRESSKATSGRSSGGGVVQTTSRVMTSDIIESGTFKGVSRNVLKQAVDNDVEVLVGSLNSKYAEGKKFELGGKEYTVTKGAKFDVDDSKRVTISFTGERQTKTENISREINAVLLPGDGVNAAHMGFSNHKDTKTPIKKRR